MDWQTNWLIDWKIDWQIDWLIDWLTHWQIEWLMHWLIDSLTDSLNDCLIDFICWFKTAFSSTVSSYWLHTAYSGWCSIFAEQQQVLSKQVLSFFFSLLIIMLVHQWNKRELFNLFLHRRSLIFGALFLLHAASAKLTTVSKLVRKLLFIFLSWHVSLLFLLFYSPITNVQRALYTDLLCCWLGGTVA